MRACRAAVLAILGWGVAQAAGAQGKPAVSPPEFASSITLVAVPVFVTDRDGRAAGGLTALDFELFDDGRFVPIVGFREIDASLPVPAGGTAMESAAFRRQFLLLFDLSFSSVNGLVRSRQAAIEFVSKSLGPSDLASVATFTANHGVRVLVGFTSDRNQLRRAIETLGLVQLDRRADPLGLVYDLTDLGAALADTVPDQVGNPVADAIRAVQIRYERAQETQYRQKVLALIDGMSQLARALDAVQGRKQVIFLSSGFDPKTLVGEEGAQAVRDSEAVVTGRIWEVQTENRFGDTQVRQQLREMLRAFSSSDAVVHSVDLAGLGARGDARHQVAEPARRSGQESLAEIANLSGGRLFKDTNDLGLALREILELSRRYYVLAFEPDDLKGPGRFHKLKVRVKAKGRGVSHRSGYYERQPFAQRTPMARMFEAAEVIAKGAARGEIEVRALAIPYRGAGGRVALPVVLEIDGAGLLDRGAGENLPLEIYGYALDEAGTVEDVVGLVSNLALPKVGRRLQERGLQCHATFTLAPGKHSLRFLIRDADTGRTGSHWLDVTIPSFDAKGVLLYPPLFMDDPQRWLILEALSRGTPSAESPFRVEADPFAPIARPKLAKGRTERICLLAFDGGARYDPGSSFEIKAQLLNADGVAVPLGRFQLSRALAEPDGFRRFIVDYTPSDVAPGEYTLRVRLRDPGTGHVSESFQAVRVN